MAHKTGSGSTKNSRDSQSKRLGLKKTGFQFVTKGNVLVRQRGLYYKPGKNVKIGKDFTIYAALTGILGFTKSGYMNITPTITL